MENEQKKFSLKDELFNEELVKYLSCLLKTAYPKLNKAKFEKDILSKFPELELMERIYWMREVLEKHLPNDYETVISILLNSLKKDEAKEAFIFACYCDYVAVHGCNKKFLPKSLSTLGEFTQYFSAEFSIRKFINEFPDQTFNEMLKWSESKNEHQRRLASEGLRPKLPWAKAINFDYRRGAEPLDNLFYDKSRYVTRSVANHLNDISKFDADFVLDKLEEWKESNKQNSFEMDYIINHSLRTLIKKGNRHTLDFLGYPSNPKLKVVEFTFKSDKINLGETLKFNLKIESETNQNLLIDYKVTYPMPGNKLSEKVFKLKKVEASKGEQIFIDKKHKFKKMTTKKLYTGKYLIGIQVNGKIVDTKSFYLNT